MKKKKKSGKIKKIGIADYMKAIKKANRELELEESKGWKVVDKVHKNKKTYSRKRNKRIPKTEE